MLYWVPVLNILQFTYLFPIEEYLQCYQFFVITDNATISVLLLHMCWIFSVYLGAAEPSRSLDQPTIQQLVMVPAVSRCLQHLIRLLFASCIHGCERIFIFNMHFFMFLFDSAVGVKSLSPGYSSSQYLLLQKSRLSFPCLWFAVPSLGPAQVSLGEPQASGVQLPVGQGAWRRPVPVGHGLPLPGGQCGLLSGKAVWAPCQLHVVHSQKGPREVFSP